MRDRGAAVRRRRRALLAATAFLVIGVTAGCTDDPSDDGSLAPSATPSTTPVSELDLSEVVAIRAPFCEALDEEGVIDVLGGAPEVTDSYGSGERTELTAGLKDVAHEFSCYFERGEAAQRRTARAWLFAQAVTPAQARRWLAERRAGDCRSIGGMSFGDPGLVRSCANATRRRVTAAGLFGDGWLTCQVTAPVSLPEDEMLETSQRWCAEVAQTTATP